MPPKPKFTKDEIVAAALEIVSKCGADALTARDLGAALGSSARPIFTVFRSMDEVQEEVRKAAMQRFESFAAHPIPDMPRFKQVGMQMILFGMHEPKLYRLLFMQENGNAQDFEDIFGMLGPVASECIASIEEMYHLQPEQANLLFENVWIYTFGIGALCATGVCRFTSEQLGKMLTTEFSAMMLLIRSQEGEKSKDGTIG